MTEVGDFGSDRMLALRVVDFAASVVGAGLKAGLLSYAADAVTDGWELDLLRGREAIG